MGAMICCLSFKWKKQKTFMFLAWKCPPSGDLPWAPRCHLFYLHLPRVPAHRGPPLVPAPTPCSFRTSPSSGAHSCPPLVPWPSCCATQTYTGPSLTFLGSFQTPHTRTPSQDKCLWLTQCRPRVLLSHCPVTVWCPLKMLSQPLWGRPEGEPRDELEENWCVEAGRRAPDNVTKQLAEGLKPLFCVTAKPVHSLIQGVIIPVWHYWAEPVLNIPQFKASVSLGESSCFCTFWNVPSFTSV